MIAVTQSEYDILSVYMQYPFASQGFVSQQLGKSRPAIWNHLSELTQRLNVVDAYSTQLGVFYSIGWIQSRPLTLYDNYLLEIESQHREVFNLMVRHPYMSAKQMLQHTDIKLCCIKNQLLDIYRMSGVLRLARNKRQSARLRLYAILGWYVPTMEYLTTDWS